MTQILVVEDDSKIRANLLFHLREEGWLPEDFETAESALERLRQEVAPPDLLLVDVRLPGRSGIDLIRELAAEDRLPPTLVITGEATIAETVEGLRLGVIDFIEKPFSRERLRQSVRNALRQQELSREVVRLRGELAERREILGRSEPMLQLFRQIAQVAPTEARILLRGESGTGKELVADALHCQSARAAGPFIKVNCAAIAPQLVEDELFGHVRGAFTDARHDKLGLFEAADGGTLFLDEIGDMHLDLQSRLLRVLEDGRVRRVGATRDREVDVRIFAATHTDLEEAVREGRFREDLFFRLSAVPLEIPPLRERLGDVRLLFEHFLARALERHRMLPRHIEEEVFERLDAYSWPGNVRELQNLCERLAVLGTDPLTEDQLGVVATGPAPSNEIPYLLRDRSALPLLPWREFRSRVEREYLEDVLARMDWNVSAAARALGIDRTHLHHKLAQLGARRGGL